MSRVDHSLASPYKNSKELVNECVDVHLALADSCLQQARGKAVGMDGITTDQATQAARLAWSAMQRARLFCFDPSRWINLYHVSNRYTTRLAGLDWKPNRNSVRLRPDEINVDFTKLWGIPLEEAKQRGWLLRRDDGATTVTERGWMAVQAAIAKMPEDKRNRLRQMSLVGEAAAVAGDTAISLMASTQIENFLEEEKPEDTEKLISVYEDHGVRWPFPDPLPFDSCFFCFGKRLNLVYSPTALHTRVRPEELGKLGVASVYLLGYLVAWEGDVPFIFTALQFGDGDGTYGISPLKTSAVGLIRTYEDEEWTQPMSLDPWILSMLVKAINDHKNIIDNFGPTLATRMARKKASKATKQLLPLPAPFYMVNLKDELITAPLTRSKQTSGRPVEWSHRWDVRGHECVRVERGDLPVPDRETARLKKRGYRIYEGMNLTAEDAGRLLKRGVQAPGPRQWIAVLSYWRDSFIKGPRDRPYVPAARTEPT